MRKPSYATVMLLATVLIAPLFISACGKSVGETIDDATITTRVKTALLNDPDVGGLRIDVDTFKGVVTLSDVLFEALALIRDREARAARGCGLGDGPGDRALVRDANDETGLPCEICHTRVGNVRG